MGKTAPKKKNSVTLKQRGEKIRDYFVSVYNELKKVYWPGRTTLVAYTGVVLFTVALVSLLIWGFDWLISHLLVLLFAAFA